MNKRGMSLHALTVLAVTLATVGPVFCTNHFEPTQTPSHVKHAYERIPLYFIENHGQFDDRVKYFEKGQDIAVYFTSEGIWWSFPRKDPSGEKHAEEQQVGSPSLVRVSPVGMPKDVVITAQDPQAARFNFLIGNDPKHWKTDIPAYRSVTYHNVYPGIDLKFYGTNRKLEYDVIVRPGGNPSQVKMEYTGIRDMTLNKEGDLILHKFDGGELTHRKPIVYQWINGMRIDLAGDFRIDKNPGGTAFTCGFQLPPYDDRYALVIDPVLEYSTYLGGSLYDEGSAVATDSIGNAYITGRTESLDFPTVNSFPRKPKTKIFITKLNPEGDALIYSTYIGGSNHDCAVSIAVDSNGCALVTGTVCSTDFPTVNASQATHGGALWDSFLTKLSPDGRSLVFSTYLGGTGADEGYAVALDTAGNAYVTGLTRSGNFPKTSSAFQKVFGGDYDAYVTKFSPTGALVYSTYLGGASRDEGYGIAVDSAGCAYVTGRSGGWDFPLKNALRSHSGDWDAFVTKLNASGTSLVYSTFLGTAGYDGAWGVAVDSLGNAWVVGETRSAGFPTWYPIQNQLRGTGDAFVTKLTPEGTAFQFSTYLGGSGGERITGIALDSEGNGYVTGMTDSVDFPVIEAFQPAKAGDCDLFVAMFGKTGNTLHFSSYLGGTASDCTGWGHTGNTVALDAFGNAYLTSGTSSFNFPLVNPVQDFMVSGDVKNAVLAKVNIQDLGPCTENPSSLAGSLSAYYSFNGNTNDESGNGNHAIAHGTSLTEDRAGNHDSACLFNGNYLTINDSSSIRFGKGDFAISLWVLSNDSTGTQNIVSKDWSVRLNDGKNGGKITFWTGSGNVPVAKINDGTATDSTWHHIVATRSKDLLSLYLDGILKGSASGTIVDLNQALPLYLGVRARDGYAPDCGLSGAMDDIRIYTRALSQCEIEQLHNEVPPSATHSISGRVTLAGAGLEGVNVGLTGAATASTTTDATGLYGFSDLSNGVYILTPSKDMYNFNPRSVSISVAGKDLDELDFEASPQVGSLKVILAPQEAVAKGAMWQIDGGTWQESGVTLSGVTVGSHRVSFLPLNAWDTPTEQTVTIEEDQTAMTTGAYVQQTGSLTVSITPEGAIEKGAQWQLDGGAWQPSGTTLSKVIVGSHTVNFLPVAGWDSPAEQTVTIEKDRVETASGVYVQQTGSLTVTITPSAAIAAGARWKVDTGDWQPSNAIISNLPVGSHTIIFEDGIFGWDAPPSQTVTLYKDQTATATGTYIRQTGSLSITITPTPAIDQGAMWQVDGGTWHTSGAVLPGLPVGSYLVAFKEAPGWDTPATHAVEISANATTLITAAYRDTTPPRLAPNVSPATLWPPNHKMIDVVITANAMDSTRLPVILSVGTLSSNEMQEGLGDGDVPGDWSTPVVDQRTGKIRVQLRAERSGKGDGRVYSIPIAATDAYGNVARSTVTVLVPHDKGGK